MLCSKHIDSALREIGKYPQSTTEASQFRRMPAHTIFAPILLPPPIYYAPKDHDCTFGDVVDIGHLTTSQPSFSNNTRNQHGDPGSHKDATPPRVATKLSVVWNTGARRTKAHPHFTHTHTKALTILQVAEPTLSSLGNLLFSGSRKTNFSTITTEVRPGQIRSEVPDRVNARRKISRHSVAAASHLVIIIRGKEGPPSSDLPRSLRRSLAHTREEARPTPPRSLRRSKTRHRRHVQQPRGSRSPGSRYRTVCRR